MADETKSKPLTITDDITVPVTFVNQLVNSGFLNGVVNLCFAVARFVPGEDGEIEPDLTIVSNLRMDLYAAQQLRDRLTAILEANMKPQKVTEH